MISANYIKSAISQDDERHREFTGTIYGAAGLGLITSIHTFEALDILEERLPNLINGDVLRAIKRLKGGSKSCGQLRLLEVNIENAIRRHEVRMWIKDFGIAAYEKVLPYIGQLQFAIANSLGKHNVPDINTFAAVITAQALASESAAYIERRQKLFRDLTVKTWNNGNVSIPFLFGTLSCRSIEHSLRNLARALVEPNSTGDIDLLADRDVENGCKALNNVLGKPETWAWARDKATERNEAYIND